MNKVKTVSISGISFTLEEEAHQLLDSYIKTLEGHYRSNPNGREIMEGIEERISELLIDRGCKAGVVSAATAREVIGIIGKPEDIYGEPEGERPVRRKLYRDSANKTVGGVCGGLGAYFHFDPVWLRVGLTLVTLALLFTDFEYWWVIPLTYCVLWLCIPMAVTTAQKCELRGESLSYGDIERQMDNRRDYEAATAKHNGFWSVIGRIFLVFFGILLAIIGISGLIGLVAILLGLTVAGFAMPEILSGLTSITFGLSGWQLGLLKTLTLVVVFLPFVGLLYWGISVLFNLKSPKWRPGIVLLLIWILSIVGLTVFCLTRSAKFFGTSEDTVNRTIEMSSNRLHIEFCSLDDWKDKNIVCDGDEDDYSLAYFNLEGGLSAAVWPDIKLDRNNWKTAGIKFHLEGIDLDNAESYCLFRNDTLFLAPCVYDSTHQLKQWDHSVKITIPDNVEVKIDNPIPHDFCSSFEKNGFDEEEFLKLFKGPLGRIIRNNID